MYVAKGASESNKLAESVGFIHPELGEVLLNILSPIRGSKIAK